LSHHAAIVYPSTYSLYWSVVLALYHGFCLEEICGLGIGDVYEDEGGVVVIDLNRKGKIDQ